MRYRAISAWLRAECLQLALAMLAASALAGQNPPPVDVKDASIEDLMDITVTSVSKREGKVSRSAAAIFVIGQEDIRRSGALNIPDLLRMAPGVEVEQIDANLWAISIRGFNSRYAEKVLVLVDGRTVYTPAFSGVYWDQIGVQLEDIDRIEVIRGAGGTIWGANAVNGVISIMTKSSKSTQGTRVTAVGGNQVHALGEAEYGGKAGQEITYRVFGDYQEIPNSATPAGTAANDSWRRMHSGFRSDWESAGGADSVMAEGELFANYENQTARVGQFDTPGQAQFPQSQEATGGDLMARWTHNFAGGSQTSLQAYYDSYRRSDLAAPDRIQTFDLDFQEHMAIGDRNNIVWGTGYRSSYEKVATGYSAISLTPGRQTTQLFNGFIEDEIRIGEYLWLTAGIKLEHTSRAGFEAEPNLRLLWNPKGGRHTLWGSASKAVRQPALIDTGISTLLESSPLPGNGVQLVQLRGNPNFKFEVARDYEAGYRTEWGSRFSVDATIYMTFYHHLESFEAGNPEFLPGAPYAVQIPVFFDNRGHGLNYGAELFLNWKAASRWKISPGYSYLQGRLRTDPGSGDFLPLTVGYDFPKSMFQLRSQVNLTSKVEFDQAIYYLDRPTPGGVWGQTRLDLRLARRFGESTEISIVGQNLLRPRTLEYGDSYAVTGTEAVRSVYGAIRWLF
jgi:iron complex outermembrane receptor protein